MQKQKKILNQILIIIISLVVLFSTVYAKEIKTNNSFLEEINYFEQEFNRRGTNSFFWEQLQSTNFAKYFYYNIDLVEVINGAGRGKWRIDYSLSSRLNKKKIYQHYYYFKMEKAKAKINWAPLYITGAIVAVVVFGAILVNKIEFKANF